jgi:hypothetical protein
MYNWAIPGRVTISSDVSITSVLGGRTPLSVTSTKPLVRGLPETFWGFQPPYHLV